MRLSTRFSTVCWTVSLLAVAVVAPAQETTGIVVHARGRAKAVPDTAEILGTINAEAELAGDALTKFRSARQSALEAVNGLGISDIKVDTTGFSIGPAGPTDSTSQILLRSRGGTPSPPKIAAQEFLRVKLNQVDKMDRDRLVDTLVKVIDAAKEAGVIFGPPPNGPRVSITREDNLSFVTYTLADMNAVRQAAESNALLDARAKAERLAQLSGCQLGEIRSIQESSVNYLPSSIRSSPPDTSSRLDELEVHVVLQVSFHTSPGRGASK